MNAQLEKLSDIALEYADNNTVMGSTDGSHALLYREKFAELIIKECQVVCREQRDPQNLNYKPSESFAEAIGSHFGLE